MLLSEEDKGQEEHRKFPRIEFREPVSFQMRETKKLGGCLSHDLSRGGLRVHFSEFVPVNTKIDLQIKLGNEQTASLTGRVVWAIQVPYSDTYQLGLEFLDQDPKIEARAQVEQFFRSRRFY